MMFGLNASPRIQDIDLKQNPRILDPTLHITPPETNAQKLLSSDYLGFGTIEVYPVFSKPSRQQKCAKWN